MTDQPTGTIIVNGEPMRYWLPEGVTPESIGLEDSNEVESDEIGR